MKIGDYVRTEYGIAKCISFIPIRENSFLYEFDVMVYEENEEKVHILTASELEKYKFSDKLTDLIKVGDYINGHRVNYINKDRKRFNITFGDDYFNLKSKFNNDIYWLSKEDIKSIVTKEQFESMKYRIGE